MRDGGESRRGTIAVLETYGGVPSAGRATLLRGDHAPPADRWKAFFLSWEGRANPVSIVLAGVTR
jgi:hypothetical protein